MSAAEDTLLVRYTSLGSLLDLLRNKRLTLTSPLFWEDGNDAFSLNEYRLRKQANSILALCFTQAAETFHHWKVFTRAEDGVRIEFNRKPVIDWVSQVKELTGRKVIYEEIKKFKSNKYGLDDLPFLKRYPYRDELEFRLIHLASTEPVEPKHFDFDPNWVRRITVNPWMTEDKLARTKTAIRSVEGYGELDVFRTTVLNNKQWRGLIGRVAVQ
jgi:hypothetical protein